MKDGRAGPAGGWQRVNRLAVLAGVVLFALGNAPDASAQRLRGRLLDLSTEIPLEGGLLTLRNAGGVPVMVTLSDEKGDWDFELPGPGVYYLEANRMGYETWVAGPLEIQAGDDLTSVYHLWPKPIEMDPIEVSVVATRRHLELAGFYERQRSDFGTFLGPEEIEKKRAPRITDLLQGLPGVRLVAMNAGSTGRRFVQLRGSNLSQGGVCRPRIFVDGLLYALGDSKPKLREQTAATEMEMKVNEEIDQGLGIDDIGPPSDLAGIEIYRSSTEVPVQFGGTGAQTLCGVIVVWTKRGVQRPKG